MEVQVSDLETRTQKKYQEKHEENKQEQFFFFLLLNNLSLYKIFIKKLQEYNLELPTDPRT